jgi:hypothetical protein
LDFDPIFEAIGDFFENPVIQFGIRAIAIYIIVLWLASAYWAFRCTVPHQQPRAPYLAATRSCCSRSSSCSQSSSTARPAERISGVKSATSGRNFVNEWVDPQLPDV